MKQSQEVTIQEVKSCIGYEENSYIHLVLSNMCDCWYGIAKQQGKSNHEAALEALDKLGKNLNNNQTTLP